MRLRNGGCQILDGVEPCNRHRRSLPSVRRYGEFGPEIWVANGPVASLCRFPGPTRMAVIQLSSGGLFVWSPIALSTRRRKSQRRPSTSLQITRPPFGFDEPAEAVQRA